MTEDKFYQELVSKMTEVSEVAPQRIGPFTKVYKRVTPFVKRKPFRLLSISSLLVAAFLYLLFGALVVKLVSILQYGF
ncbi:hypothetical protein HYW54_02575 [Candidatus Gottesmanbacteria bacterium]|nr:hypothetical protein [Candidatus Gottesmanbacteria bacterium]